MSGFAKGTLGAVVPSKNSADNVYTRDVIGNKTDNESGDSLYSKIYIAEKHVHGACKVAPTLATGITVTATTGAGAWTLGAFSSDIIAAGAVADPFDIHYINIESLSANTTYELVLYYGAGDTEAGRVRFSRLNNNEAQNAVPFMSPLIPGGSRVRAKLATPADDGENCVISVYYHTY